MALNIIYVRTECGKIYQSSTICNGHSVCSLGSYTFNGNIEVRLDYKEITPTYQFLFALRHFQARAEFPNSHISPLQGSFQPLNFIFLR